MPELLSKSGVYTHLATDHYHYWEDGGCTYHNRYNSYEFVRGQEGDKWKGSVAPPRMPEPRHGTVSRQDLVNRLYLRSAEEMPATLTFDKGMEFLETNRDQDRWFLQIECFCPHPPFLADQRHRELYTSHYKDLHYDWPQYGPVTEGDTPEKIDHLRKQYASVISHCDESLGRVLDFMDQHEMWEDTMLIVSTDHGFLLGEHGWFAFVKAPFYDQVAVKPLFVHDPRSPHPGERRESLVQLIDLPATLLEYFGVERPADMQGRPILPVLKDDTPIRDYGIFGVFGREINCTDGRYVYMHAPAEAEAPLYQYTLQTTEMRRFLPTESLRQATLHPPLAFTKGMPVLRIPAQPFMGNPPKDFGHKLFDLQEDPHQMRECEDEAVTQRLRGALREMVMASDPPAEWLERMGL